MFQKNTHTPHLESFISSLKVEENLKLSLIPHQKPYVKETNDGAQKFAKYILGGFICDFRLWDACESIII